MISEISVDIMEEIHSHSEIRKKKKNYVTEADGKYIVCTGIEPHWGENYECRATTFTSPLKSLSLHNFIQKPYKKHEFNQIHEPFRTRV